MLFLSIFQILHKSQVLHYVFEYYKFTFPINIRNIQEHLICICAVMNSIRGIKKNQQSKVLNESCFWNWRITISVLYFPRLDLSRVSHEKQCVIHPVITIGTQAQSNSGKGFAPFEMLNPENWAIKVTPGHSTSICILHKMPTTLLRHLVTQLEQIP